MIKKLSVITINYNNKQGLIDTIESVIMQTFCDYEFIVIDGGSTDGSFEILQQYNDKIDYWVSEPDKGIYHAMNKGVKMATGEYCNFMNSGDCFYCSKTLKNVFALNLSQDIFIGKAKTKHRVILPPNIPTLSYFFRRKPINHQAAFIKRALLNKYPYDEVNYKIVSDYDFFFKALIVENCSYSSINVFVVNFDDSGIGSINININKIEQYKVISTHIYPRILEDYNKNSMQYSDYFIVKFSVNLANLFDKYSKYIKINKYSNKIKKILRKKCKR